ncbi:alpha-hydroxyketone-type quorum-sensing autoinducer synthase [Salinisphaera sp.]|uniref:alpha-hydroxyketone-type quorum-sensing autoinducer synthase n=1 Tax=Salinisphaera sp. TaxID=1914330 RepID=UPI002D79E9FA|nr:alpha-hydroxyketone-type quorum-sensing autoinducer synthase [Salinisphaera sp.]HET7314076.1 alpha-hydroxyketone-type quorum-sensing autoinducer synthase [Salinisphaera sp.]
MSNLSIFSAQNRDACVAAEPDFLSESVDKYYNERGETWQEGSHIMRGSEPEPGAVMMVSNDYLDLANHSAIRQAQIDALNATDNTMVMSAVYLHGNSPQEDFEKRMADWMAMESTLVCQSGYAANVGLIQAIGGADKPVYIDMMAHASLWQGIQAAGLQAKPFRHNSSSHLASLIKRNGPGIVVIDSVYSTNGSVAPVAEIVDVAHQAGCVMIVDESHSLGTHGWQGSGIVAGLGLQDKVHFVTASLAKAFAGRAGLIACSRRLAEFIKYHSFPAIFSSALLPPDIAALDKTLDLIKSADEQRQRLFENTTYLRDHLAALGYNVDISKAQIIALEAGPEHHTIVLRDALEANGVFGSVFCAPATAANRSLIRLSINAGLTRRELDHVIKVCRDIRDEVDLANWPSTLRAQRQVTESMAA